MANWTGSATLANDYLFNGISQTSGDTAAQAGITWSSSSGIYLSTWTSNIDFAKQANFELDAYVGYYQTISPSMAVDIGISQYSYHGSQSSSALNFTESYLKVEFHNSRFNFWYSWDYFGSNARHLVMMAKHRFIISNNSSIHIGIDKSISFDLDKWQWQPKDRDYLHGQITGQYLIDNFTISLGIHATDLDNTGKTRILFSISRSFGE